MSHIEIGKRVLKTEADGLIALRDSLDHRFEEAVNGIIQTLERTKGRVILTGMGKSGHIAHKISATLASTGTPAFFVHPAEANHGDLGMVTKDDIVIALSESGESQELAGIITYSQRHNIPLIAMTREVASTLGSASNHQLLVPAVEPACPLRLAPTSSTTMMLALGDAVAIALLEWRGFSSDDFKDFHPGGALGKNLLKVKELMHGPDKLPLINSDATVREAALEISDKHFGCVGVLDHDKLIGIITDGDLRRHVVNHLDNKGLREKSVMDMMTRDPKVTKASALAVQALSIMNRYNITALFVVDEAGKPTGILHIHDCLAAGLK